MTKSKTIQHYQTVILEDDMEKLKEIIDVKATKEALAFSVDFTIKNYKKVTALEKTGEYIEETKGVTA